METRKLGAAGPEVSALGLGCMGMSGVYGPADRAESIATIHAALDAGITLLDTGDFYGMGHNEMLIGTALASVPRDRFLVSVKFGTLRDRHGAWLGYDLRPKAIRNFLAYSLRRLGLDHIDIYRPARLDPEVPVEEVVGTLAELVQAGDIRHVGLSEVGAATLRRAAAVHPISDLQIEYSLASRGIEAEILPTARALGTGITAYGVLSRGLIGGEWRGDPFPPGDIRRLSPRFQGENAGTNLRLVAALHAVAETRGLTTAQAAIAWVAGQGADIVPLVGTKRRDRLAEALGALDARLEPGDLAAIEAAVPRGAVAGARYPEAHMTQLDSER
jgi:aryl-alcohol dehydrogenase-like predicted oxidoreductase